MGHPAPTGPGHGKCAAAGPMGFQRESGQSPFGRSRCRNIGRGPGRESSGRRMQGARKEALKGQWPERGRLDALCSPSPEGSEFAFWSWGTGGTDIHLFTGCKGADAPCPMGPGSAEMLHGRMQRRLRCNHPARLDAAAGWCQSLGERAPKGRENLGIALGGPRGM